MSKMNYFQIDIFQKLSTTIMKYYRGDVVFSFCGNFPDYAYYAPILSDTH